MQGQGHAVKQLACSLKKKNVKTRKEKERLSDWFGLSETKETWELNAKCNSGLDSEPNGIIVIEDILGTIGETGIWHEDNSIILMFCFLILILWSFMIKLLFMGDTQWSFNN